MDHEVVNVTWLYEDECDVTILCRSAGRRFTLHSVTFRDGDTVTVRCPYCNAKIYLEPVAWVKVANEEV